MITDFRKDLSFTSPILHFLDEMSINPNFGKKFRQFDSLNIDNMRMLTVDAISRTYDIDSNQVAEYLDQYVKNIFKLFDTENIDQDTLLIHYSVIIYSFWIIFEICNGEESYSFLSKTNFETFYQKFTYLTHISYYYGLLDILDMKPKINGHFDNIVEMYRLNKSSLISTGFCKEKYSLSQKHEFLLSSLYPYKYPDSLILLEKDAIQFSRSSFQHTWVRNESEFIKPYTQREHCSYDEAYSFFEQNDTVNLIDNARGRLYKISQNIVGRMRDKFRSSINLESLIEESAELICNELSKEEIDFFLRNYILSESFKIHLDIPDIEFYSLTEYNNYYESNVNMAPLEFNDINKFIILICGYSAEYRAKVFKKANNFLKSHSIMSFQSLIKLAFDDRIQYDTEEIDSFFENLKLFLELFDDNIWQFESIIQDKAHVSVKILNNEYMEWVKRHTTINVTLEAQGIGQKIPEKYEHQADEYIFRGNMPIESKRNIHYKFREIVYKGSRIVLPNKTGFEIIETLLKSPGIRFKVTDFYHYYKELDRIINENEEEEDLEKEARKFFEHENLYYDSGFGPRRNTKQMIDYLFERIKQIDTQYNSAVERSDEINIKVLSEARTKINKLLSKLLYTSDEGYLKAVNSINQNIRDALTSFSKIVFTLENENDRANFNEFLQYIERTIKKGAMYYYSPDPNDKKMWVTK